MKNLKNDGIGLWVKLNICCLTPVIKNKCSCALLTRYEVDAAGKRTVLGVNVELAEAEVHWRNFMESIAARGIHGLKLIVSDNHQGGAKRPKSGLCFGSVAAVSVSSAAECIAYIPKKSMQSQVHADIKAIINAKEKREAERLLQKTNSFDLEYFLTKICHCALRCNARGT